MSHGMMLDDPNGQGHRGYGDHENGGYTITYCGQTVYAESGWRETNIVPSRSNRCSLCWGPLSATREPVSDRVARSLGKIAGYLVGAVAGAAIVLVIWWLL